MGVKGGEKSTFKQLRGWQCTGICVNRVYWGIA